MVRLFAVEVRRLLARRAIRITALVVLGFVVIGMGNEFRTSGRLDADLRARVEQAERAGTLGPDFIEGPSAVPVAPGEEAPGEEAPSGGFGPQESVFRTPEEAIAYSREFRLRDELSDIAAGVGIFAFAAAFLMGATAGGAEWSAGTMQALLFWEPRRIRVILAKVLALAVVVLAFAVLMQLLAYGGSMLVATARGSTRGTDGEFWRILLGRSGRVVALAPFGGLLSFGIAGFTRNTGFALGAGFVYLVIVENVVQGVFPWARRYLVGINLVGWVDNGIDLTRDRFVNGEFVQDVVRISGTRAGLTLALYLAVVIGALAASFAYRDVT